MDINIWRLSWVSAQETFYMCMTTGSRGIWTPQDRPQAPPRRGWNSWDMLEEEKWRRLAELGATPLSTGERPARAWPAGSWRRSSAGRPSGSRGGGRRSGRGWSPRRSPHAARPETSASWTHGGNTYRSDRHRWEVQNTLWPYLSGVLFFSYLYFYFHPAFGHKYLGLSSSHIEKHADYFCF